MTEQGGKQVGMLKPSIESRLALCIALIMKGSNLRKTGVPRNLTIQDKSHVPLIF